MKTNKNKIVVASMKVSEEKLRIFKALAALKYTKNPMQNAWDEAITLFIEKNRHLLKKYKL